MSPWQAAAAGLAACFWACLAIGFMRGINHSGDFAFQSQAMRDHMTAGMPRRWAAGMTQGLRRP